MDESKIFRAETLWLTVQDKTKLFVRRWIPLLNQAPRGVLQIVHGMAEHSGRYERVASALCKVGIESWCADMRGHGKTADLSVNPPDKGGLLGHCADKGTNTLVMSDIDLINNAIKETYSNTPLFLLGHSWGSFLAQNYIETHSKSPIKGCILSGTRGPDGIKISLAKPLMNLLAFFKGCRNPSELSYILSDGPFNKPFRPNRTPFDWLSRDEKEVDAYFNDPLSGKRCSSGFYRDLANLLNTIHKPSAMNKIRPELAIYIFAGSADPVGDMGTSPAKLVSAYRELVIRDLEFVLYPDARHETFNETNRDEVIANLSEWILKHCEGGSVES